ncbi:hypothetical protein BAE44_0005675, partial [Dichanthelium oligosanthes]
LPVPQKVKLLAWRLVHRGLATKVNKFGRGLERVIFGASSAEEVEAMACKEGIQLAVEWTSSPAILESGCVAVIQYLKETNKVRPACYFTIHGARSIASHLPRLVLSHVKRDLNVVANE